MQFFVTVSLLSTSLYCKRHTGFLWQTNSQGFVSNSNDSRQRLVYVSRFTSHYGWKRALSSFRNVVIELIYFEESKLNGCPIGRLGYWSFDLCKC